MVRLSRTHRHFPWKPPVCQEIRIEQNRDLRHSTRTAAKLMAKAYNGRRGTVRGRDRRKLVEPQMPDQTSLPVHWRKTSAFEVLHDRLLADRDQHPRLPDRRDRVNKWQLKDEWPKAILRRASFPARFLGPCRTDGAVPPV